MKMVKNPFRLFAYVILLLFISAFVFCFIKSNSIAITRTNSFTIPTPAKIVLYDNGKTQTLTPTDKNFNKALELLSERLGNMSSLKIDTMAESIDTFTYDETKSCRCLQLVYDNETMMKLPSDEKDIEIKFRKLHFLVAAECDQDYGTTLVYGDDTTTRIIDEDFSDTEVMCKLLRLIRKEIR